MNLTPNQRMQLEAVLRRFDGLIEQAEELRTELLVSAIPAEDPSIDQLDAHIRDLREQRDWFASYLAPRKED